MLFLVLFVVKYLFNVNSIFIYESAFNFKLSLVGSLNDCMYLLSTSVIAGYYALSSYFSSSNTKFVASILNRSITTKSLEGEKITPFTQFNSHLDNTSFYHNSDVLSSLFRFSSELTYLGDYRVLRSLGLDSNSNIIEDSCDGELLYRYAIGRVSTSTSKGSITLGKDTNFIPSKVYNLLSNSDYYSISPFDMNYNEFTKNINNNYLLNSGINMSKQLR